MDSKSFITFMQKFTLREDDNIKVLHENGNSATATNVSNGMMWSYA